MSQKTHPLSVRLQSRSCNFTLPWFSDYFFHEKYNYDLFLQKYLAVLLEEREYVKGALSIQSEYRKLSTFLVLRDARAEEKEDHLAFSLPTHSLFNRNSLSYFPDLSLLRNKSSINRENASFFQSISKEIINDFFKYTQNHNLTLVFSALSYLQFFSSTLSQNKDSVLSRCLVSLNASAQHKIEEKRTIDLTCSFCDNVNSDCAFDYDYDGDSDYEGTFSDLYRKLEYRFAKGKAIESKSISFSPFFFSSYLSNMLIKERKERKNTERAISQTMQSSSHCDLLKKQVALRYVSLSKSKEGFPGCIEELQEEKLQSSSQLCTQENDLSSCDNIVTDPFAYLSSQGVFQRTKYQDTQLFPIINSFHPIRFIKHTQSVENLLYSIVSLIEKRVAFRRIKSKVFADLQSDSSIKGVKIICNGRLGGRSKKAQKAKMQSDSWGNLALNAFSSKVVWGRKSALTSYGKVGIKIWLCFKDEDI